jgi:hypothetical protein
MTAAAAIQEWLPANIISAAIPNLKNHVELALILRPLRIKRKRSSHVRKTI